MNTLVRFSSYGPQSVRCVAWMVASLLLGAMLTTVGAEDAKNEWPQFLGPHRNGISDETGLLTEWPTDGPAVVWRKPGGVGMSGIAVSRGKVITLIQHDGQQWVICLDAKSGQSVWEKPIAPAYKNGMGNGPRATPAIAGELVMVFTGEGILAAVNFADGKIIWSRNLIEELKGSIADYGMACSPLVIGNDVIVTVGCPGASVVAYEAKTGKPVWKAGDDPAGYSSPTLLELSGRKQLVVYTGLAAVGLVPETGAALWRYPYETNFNCNIATPIAFHDQVFISSGENHGCVMLSLKPTSKGIDVAEAWSSEGSQSVLRNEWQTSVLHDGHLYGFDNVGAAGPVTHLTCVSAETGKRVWQKLRFGKGNLIAADGKLWISTIKGELVAVRLTPKSFEEFGREQVLGATRQAPALCDGLLYLRDDQEIVCLDIRKR